MGRVFRGVMGKGVEDKVAIKVVLKQDAVTLEKEFLGLTSVWKDRLDDNELPLVKPCSAFTASDSGAGYAQTPQGLSSLVGLDLTHPINKVPLAQHACLALFDLHKAKLTHGDPRLENFLKTPGRDRRYQVVLSDPANLNSSPGILAFTEDLKIFAKSCGLTNFEQSSLEAYAKAMTNGTGDYDTHMEPISKRLLATSSTASASSSSSTCTLEPAQKKPRLH